MPSLFADTHNVAAIIEKSDASEGFAQIIDFLSGSYIHYALTVSPHIYISCIKQFWNTAVVKRSGDVTRTSWNEFSTAMASALQVDLSCLRWWFVVIVNGLSSLKLFARRDSRLNSVCGKNVVLLVVK
nr:hypothetical protein [Tanacetum cinerariifolium]